MEGRFSGTALSVRLINPGSWLARDRSERRKSREVRARLILAARLHHHRGLRRPTSHCGGYWRGIAHAAEAREQPATGIACARSS